ncbi:MerR family DNA-binding transcriptional regulator, partial [Acinetobacter nosocomialis]
MMKYLIGELAKKSHVAVDTIRFYEKRGLLQPAKRAENNYRYYDD